jgi:hypothetical protein
MEKFLYHVSISHYEVSFVTRSASSHKVVSAKLLVLNKIAHALIRNFNPDQVDQCAILFETYTIVLRIQKIAISNSFC